jgi:hypothetical protein
MELGETVARENGCGWSLGLGPRAGASDLTRGGHFWDDGDRWIWIDGEELLGSERLFTCNL